MSAPFDPFSYDDEPSDDTSKTTNTTNKQRQQQQQQSNAHVPETPLQLSRSTSANKRLPPRLNVKLSYHEEVSSNSIKSNAENVVGSLSRLSVTGKIMVSRAVR